MYKPTIQTFILSYGIMILLLSSDVSSFSQPFAARRLGSIAATLHSQSPLRAATVEDADWEEFVPMEGRDFFPEQNENVSSLDAVAPQERKPSLATWKKRLNTKEDKLSLHKWAGLAFALSSAVILGTGLVNGIQNDVPAFLEPVNAIFYLSILVECVSSFEMADSHRRNQPAVRDAFKGAAWATMFAATGALLNSPFVPDIIADHKVLSDLLVGGLGVGAIGSSMMALFTKEELISARSKNKKNQSDIDDVMKDPMINVNYWFSALFTPAVFLIMMLAFLHPNHDHEWMLQYQNEHGGQALFYYVQVYGNTATMWSNVITTLRDKKLINKDLESKLLFGLQMQTPLTILPLII